MNEWNEYEVQHFRCDKDGELVHIRQPNQLNGEGLNESISFGDLGDTNNKKLINLRLYCEQANMNLDIQVHSVRNIP